jgi:hypothetical protein
MQLESRQPLFARLLGLEDQSVVVSTSGVRILVARDEIGGEERPIGPAREVPQRSALRCGVDIGCRSSRFEVAGMHRPKIDAEPSPT